jgi:hypothetical protein
VTAAYYEQIADSGNTDSDDDLGVDAESSIDDELVDSLLAGL